MVAFYRPLFSSLSIFNWQSAFVRIHNLRIYRVPVIGVGNYRCGGSSKATAAAARRIRRSSPQVTVDLISLNAFKFVLGLA